MASETYKADNLIGDNYEVITGVVTVLADETHFSSTEKILKRGTLLTQVTAAGPSQNKFRRFNTTNADGSEVISSYPVILAEDVDTTSDAVAAVYKAGAFSLEYVGAKTNVDFFSGTILATLRNAGIHIVKTYEAGT